ncbi:MAG: hypothetical protein QOE70_1668 [Chthoniobacter sp.]|jgi:hypothetical protein|nr:hypothetical protein [Chthoniobacter sp.]
MKGLAILRVDYFVSFRWILPIVAGWWCCAAPLSFSEQTASDTTSRDADAYLAEWQGKAEKLFQAWKVETDPAAKRALAEELIEAAVRAGQSERIEAVAAEGRFAEREIGLPAAVREVPLESLYAFPDMAVSSRGDGESWVSRRITKDAFELWIPTHGWLFNGQGRLTNEARPPRRDGQGREWYGAFLPSGPWITTDLWERDDTLTFFSRSGRWQKEIHSDKLVPPPDPGEADLGLHSIDLIGWARADRHGRGWIVSVGSEGGRGEAWIGAQGPPRAIQDRDAWKLAYPRALGPRMAGYTTLLVPSDDRKMELQRFEPAHGPQVGYPDYSLHGTEEVFSVKIPEGGREFGFWPGTRHIFIDAERAHWEGDGPTKVTERQRTWFFDPKGHCEGWIAARRIADAPDGKAMLFTTNSGLAVTLEPDLGVRQVQRWIWPGGQPALPSAVFPDLKLGFFLDGRKVRLARWR